MNVILATLGSSGDVFPFIAIGKGMIARGHRATLVTNPHFESAARAAGLDFAPVSDAQEYLRITKNPNLWRPLRGLLVISREIMIRGIEPVFEAIQERFEPGETVVVANGLAYGARIAHEALAVPLVTVFLQPLCVRSLVEAPVLPVGGFLQSLGPLGTRALYRFGDLLTDFIQSGPTNKFRRSFGLPPARRLMSEWWMSPQRTVGVWPQWFAPSQSDWPACVRLADFIFHDAPSTGDNAAADAFFSEGEPPILFTPGTGMRHGRKFFAAAAEACSLMGRRGALVTPYVEHVPRRLPTGVVHLPYVPFGEYLPRAGAIVHHGGIGTVAQAFAAGIPQVVRPMGFDQFDNGARVERLGVGVSIRSRGLRAKRLAEALDGLLSSEQVASRCRELSDRTDRDRGIRLTCEAIEKTAADAWRVGRERDEARVARDVLP